MLAQLQKQYPQYKLEYGEKEFRGNTICEVRCYTGGDKYNYIGMTDDTFNWKQVQSWLNNNFKF